jgi:hypothetical protein
MGSTFYGHALFPPGNRSLLWQIDRPDVGLYLLCGIECAAAFVRGVWAAGFEVTIEGLSFFSSWSSRLQPSSAVERTSIE